VSRSDPEVRDLAASIRANGIQEPLVITLDGYILSGHRRHVAANLAGLKSVPCRIENIRRTDPGFVLLLRECNRQRVKSLAEVTREQVLDADPEEAHRVLVEHRRRQSKIDATDAIQIVGHKHRAKISEAKRPFLDAVLRILDERREYWPLSVRVIHYALLNIPPLIHASKRHSLYRNTIQSYKAAIDLCTRARLAGVIPWESIDDETRPITTWDVHQSIAPFERRELDRFLKDYYRDLLQSQPNQIEIIGEKNSIANILRPVAMEYCVPLTIGRGYSSLPPRYKMAQRFRASGKDKLIVLVLSDFDPEGEDIAHSFARSMRDDFGVEDIVPIKVALTRQQVDDLHLPPMMTAKKSSSRRDGFVARHGEDVFELEAVPPVELQQILRTAIDGVIDVAAFNAEIDAEKRDAAHLDAVRRAVQAQLADLNFEEES
jgi:ParB-like chromosome segregation protein Spo0J